MNLKEALQKINRNTAVVENNPGLVYLDYRVGAHHMFNKTTINFRGMIFNQHTGEQLSAPLHKFFNVNECPSTKFKYLKDQSVKMVMEKADGTFIQFFRHPQRGIIASTRRSNDNAQSNLSNELLIGNTKLKEFVESEIENRWTPCFEFVSPANYICVHYDENELIYLCSRSIKTGEYKWDCPEQVKSCQKYNFNSLRETEDNLQKIHDKEGFVVVLENGKWVKFKTAWYVRQHKIYSLMAVCDEDQLYNKALRGELTEHIYRCQCEQRILYLSEIQRKAMLDKNDLKIKVLNRFYKIRFEYQPETRKAFVDIADPTSKYFHALMAAYDNKDMDSCLNRILER